MLLGTLPGLRKEDLSIEVVKSSEGHVLEISGQSPTSAGSRGPSPSRADPETRVNPSLRASYSKFEQRIRIPRNIDPSTLQAKYQDGLLVVSMLPLTKTEQSQRQKIAIQ